jgi:hypothetical protein
MLFNWLSFLNLDKIKVLKFQISRNSEHIYLCTIRGEATLGFPGADAPG